MQHRITTLTIDMLSYKNEHTWTMFTYVYLNFHFNEEDEEADVVLAKSQVQNLANKNLKACI